MIPAIATYRSMRRHLLRRKVLTALAVVLIISSCWLQIGDGTSRIKQGHNIRITPLSQTGKVTRPDEGRLACEGVRDELSHTVLVIKTGATESLRKLPVHFEITMRCWPHVLVLSDFTEQIDGHQIHDALELVSDNIRLHEPSFELWRRLNHGGRSVLSAADSISDGQDGWRLARYMNLPMAVKAFEFKSDAKWYVFIDADTYISWSNFLGFTSYLDHTRPYYLGSQAAMGPGEFFGHGGSGYVLSHNATSRLVESYQAQQFDWDVQASNGEFGEVPLARLLLTLDIPLSWALPHFQGGNPSAMDFGLTEHGRNLWCYPAITYHHISDDGIRGLSQFEAAWRSNTEVQRHFRHSDVFKGWVWPQLIDGERQDWDNSSDDLVDGVNDVTSCREACQKHIACVQYSFHMSQCKISAVPKLGSVQIGSISGWLKGRAQEVMQSLDSQCEEMFHV